MEERLFLVVGKKAGTLLKAAGAPTRWDCLSVLENNKCSELRYIKYKFLMILTPPPLVTFGDFLGNNV